MINNGRAKIENAFGTLNIIIPSKKNWFALVFATVWLGGWFFGFTMASSMLFNTSVNGFAGGFMTFWLIAWTVGGFAIISILLWGYFGQEQFTSDHGEVFLNKTVFGVGIKKRMEVNELKNFRAEVINSNYYGGNRWAYWGLGPGKIKFDYGLKTFSFGLGIDDAEANHIVELLNNHFKKS